MSLRSRHERQGRGPRWPGATLGLVLGGAAIPGGCTACAEQAAGRQISDGGATSSTTGWTFSGSSSATTSSSSPTGGRSCAELEGWTHLEGVSPVCAACVPQSLELVSPLLWQPCADGTPGCRELVVDWPNDGERPFYVNFAGTSTADGPVVVIGRVLDAELSGWGEMVMAYADGPVLAAVRGTWGKPAELCMPAIASFGAGRAVASVADFVTGPSLHEYLFEIPIATGQVRVFNTLTPELLHGNSAAGARSPGPLFAAVTFSPATKILKVPYDGSVPTVIAAFSMEHSWLPDEPVTVDSDVLFFASDGLPGEERGQSFIYHAATATTESYLDRPGWDVFPMRTDGTTMVWIQISPPYHANGGNPPDALELWTSPYAPSPSGVVPQKVADLHVALWNPHYRLESGLLVLRSSLWQPPSDDYGWSRLIILRLADRTYWTLDAPDGDWWGRPMYVTADEIAMPVHPAWDQTRAYTIRRQQLAALGPPAALDGLLGVP